MKKTLLTTLAMAAALSASAGTTPDLVTNGEPGNNLDGWTNFGSSTFSRWFDGMDYNWFRAGGNGCCLSQTIVLADKGITPRDIASGASVTASVIAQGGNTGNATVYQLGANDDILASNTVFSVSNAVASTSYPEIEFALNPSTRKLKYELVAKEIDSSYTLKFRDCELKITTVPQYQITFVSEGVTVGMVTNWSIAAVTPPTVNRDGYHFFGYYTLASDGEQVFDENGAYVLSPGSTWTPTDDVTLYAHWMLSVVNFSFVSSDSTVGSAEYQASSTAPEAPIALKRSDAIFLGYFTEQTGGVKVYDENYEFVLADTSILTDPNTTLYAQWKVVPRNLEGGITRLVYRGVLTNFGEWSSGLSKNMRVKVYDSASAAEPLWSGDVANVPINPDGSFEAVFGNDELALAFASNNLTHVELTVGDSLSPLAPRRAFASVASVNRALVAEGAASDIKVGTLGANAIVAEKITATSLEASETVRVEGSVSVEVKPFDIERGRETTIWRGAGVSAWGESRHIQDFDNVVAGQFLWTADSDGVVMIHCSGSTRSTLRIPATIQFVRPGDEVRAPTYENGKVSVTFWSYKK